jgi:hypothetical protein
MTVKPYLSLLAQTSNQTPIIGSPGRRHNPGFTFEMGKEGGREGTLRGKGWKWGEPGKLSP